MVQDTSKNWDVVLTTQGPVGRRKAGFLTFPRGRKRSRESWISAYAGKAAAATRFSPLLE
jgi:hypothetical protein